MSLYIPQTNNNSQVHNDGRRTPPPSDMTTLKIANTNFTGTFNGMSYRNGVPELFRNTISLRDQQEPLENVQNHQFQAIEAGADEAFFEHPHNNVARNLNSLFDGLRNDQIDDEGVE